MMVMFLSIAVPCFNEREVIGETNRRLSLLAERLVQESSITDYEILYVDDGSTDGTLDTLKALASRDHRIKVLSLSRNFGQQAALAAALTYATGDAIVTLDADLQDPPETIEKMLDRFKEGFEIVYGIRQSRAADALLKRLTAEWFYKLMQSMGVNLIFNHSEFRLVSRKVARNFQSYTEVNLFLRGIFPNMGFRQSVIKYERAKRLAGKTKYPFAKLAASAIEGITSFSYVPLRLIAILGFIIFVFSVALVGWALITKALGRAIPGWTSTVLPIYAFGGFQLMCIGIVGEYIGKIYMEIKRRPTFIIRETVNLDTNNKKGFDPS
jgi:glycosyltransferase involved in cell wall biosynthesis